MSNGIDIVAVGNRIKDIRVNKGLTMEEFGKNFNTSKGTVNNWEKGRNLPNKENLKLIADLGDVSVDELLYGTLEERVYALIYDNEISHNISEDRIDKIAQEVIEIFNKLNKKFSVATKILKNEVDARLVLSDPTVTSIQKSKYEKTTKLMTTQEFDQEAFNKAYFAFSKVDFLNLTTQDLVNMYVYNLNIEKDKQINDIESLLNYLISKKSNLDDFITANKEKNIDMVMDLTIESSFLKKDIDILKQHLEKE